MNGPPARALESAGTAGGQSAIDPAAQQRQRRLWQGAFFVLFVVAPWFDLLRYDLTSGHAWLLTREWHLGLDDFLNAQIGAGEAALRVLMRLFVPILLGAAIFLGVAWRWGRLYCGWLCPHFSVVETLNRLMVRACGRHSLWDKPVSRWQPDGTESVPAAAWWLLYLPLVIGFAFTWSLVFLTYLMPPTAVMAHLLHWRVPLHERLFLSAGTVVLALEFLLGRHLFCRYACAVGLFQSLAWVANPGAMVVGFDRRRASACASCLPERAAACEAVCPMRLRPRSIKRKMFACSQCAQCIAACDTVQRRRPGSRLLDWTSGNDAREGEAGFAPRARDSEP